jgi:hypothetical protein
MCGSQLLLVPEKKRLRDAGGGARKASKQTSSVGEEGEASKQTSSMRELQGLPDGVCAASHALHIKRGNI